MSGHRSSLLTAAVLFASPPALGQSDVEDVASTQHSVGGDEQQTYFLVDAAPEAPEPESGRGVLFILPGGDGSAEFNPFAKRIAKFAAPDGLLVVQLVAPKWTEDQYIIWPTVQTPVKDQQFTTEQFIAAALEDVRTSHKVDEDRLLLMGWSSSGPAVYNMLCAEQTPFDGFYISMSIFKPDQMPPVARAAGRRVVIEHSPDDRTCPFHLAEKARDNLTAAGASVQFVTYPGGHGWRGAIYPRMKEAFAFLLEGAGREEHSPSPPAGPNPDPAR